MLVCGYHLFCIVLNFESSLCESRYILYDVPELTVENQLAFTHRSFHNCVYLQWYCVMCDKRWLCLKTIQSVWFRVTCVR